MATPIRFAPVLIGQEAEQFLDRWQQTLEEPLKQPISKEYFEKYKKFTAAQRYL